MRPAGEVRTALLSAATELATAERGATLLELAHHAQVGTEVARSTVNNMRRSGVLRAVRTRRVAYRNRPVAEYAPGNEALEAARGFVDLASTWSPAPAAETATTTTATTTTTISNED
jgi:hypothetical protein